MRQSGSYTSLRQHLDKTMSEKPNNISKGKYNITTTSSGIPQKLTDLGIKSFTSLSRDEIETVDGSPVTDEQWLAVFYYVRYELRYNPSES